MVLEYLRQPVERNAAAEVMHVVNADVCGEPAQYGRKIIVRASVRAVLCWSNGHHVPTLYLRTGAVRKRAKHLRRPRAAWSEDARLGTPGRRRARYVTRREVCHWGFLI